jgi:hypothetical protein
MEGFVKSSPFNLFIHPNPCSDNCSSGETRTHNPRIKSSVHLTIELRNYFVAPTRFELVCEAYETSELTITPKRNTVGLERFELSSLHS